MAPKRAIYMTYGNDGYCSEARKFIEDAGILLDVRDLGEKPLTEEELSQLIGHLEITHFLNSLSESYSKYRLDKRLPERHQIIKLMAQDYTLLKRPIVRSARLVTVGCDKHKIAEMLQINTNGQFPEVNETGNAASKKGRRQHPVARRK